MTYPKIKGAVRDEAARTLRQYRVARDGFRKEFYDSDNKEDAVTALALARMKVGYIRGFRQALKVVGE